MILRKVLLFAVLVAGVSCENFSSLHQSGDVIVGSISAVTGQNFARYYFVSKTSSQRGKRDSSPVFDENVGG